MGQNNIKLNEEKTEVISNETNVLANEDIIEESVSLLCDKIDASQRTNCVCKNESRDSIMLTCAICQTYQHGACYRIALESDIPETHICVRCSLKDGMMCTDRKMAKMVKHEAASSTFLFRRALVVLLNVETVSISYLKGYLGIDDEFAEGILDKLIQDKVISQSISGECPVDGKLLRSLSLPKYLGIKNLQIDCGEQGSHVLKPKEILKEGCNLDVVIKVEMEDNKERVKSRDVENDINGYKEENRNESNKNNAEDNDLNKTAVGFDTVKKRKLRKGSNEYESKSVSCKKSKDARRKTSIVKQDRLLI